ncbi:MAG: M20/M25/M40 family metallo-hydrolase [Bacteroidia bacterium]|nr:M20/M25/M40 family metallo-hydrolase [Bacteroidia bacterium]MBT8276374.1 M20/M25/M40 family metallo-hydrolase [Bacteroidia bacterium]NNF30298.1 M20/M25/M40 family metallo-hydrolase [Flavobacteriaceae bacterium]NNK53557.1 M20/M25/M40 family metallo-hydrolase [Flavobacteriaceae bacterium]NNM08659.1 M20/M25/M40 family metallo-hydrolase [Flavobacteriaceae bacterium]
MKENFLLNNRITLITSLFVILMSSISAQVVNKEDSITIRSLYDAALLNGKSYDWLDHLSNEIGGRLSGSIEAEKAIRYTESELKKLGLDKVWLQPVMVPKWTRGVKEYAYIETAPGITSTTNICALGGSVATPSGGLKAYVVEVQSFEELEKLGRSAIEGKIVFYNRPMQANLIRTFEAYGGCVNQRYAGAMEAAKYGAVGVLVRSMNLRKDDYPHTGAMTYGDTPPDQRIPAAAISTNGADYLSSALKLKSDLKFYFKQSCRTYPDVQSYNVIGEITGSTYPDRYMVVGGHLDSWDLGDGSHDDGAGCVQSMEVLRLFREIGYKPKHSIRVVLFMNEENGLRGGRKYAEEARLRNEKHVFALESDAGGFTPRGFSFDTDEKNFAQIESWKSLFEPYLIHSFVKGGSGADIGPLKDGSIVLSGLRPDSQRYFDHHHSAVDTFDAVNKRELELGGATMASLVYLMDKYGTKSEFGVIKD